MTSNTGTDSQIEFRQRIRELVQVSDGVLTCDEESLASFVGSRLPLALAFITDRLNTPAPDQDLYSSDLLDVAAGLRGESAIAPDEDFYRLTAEAAAVNIAYMKKTGDSSQWRGIIELASQGGFNLLKSVYLMGPYHESALWKEALEREAAREYWLLSDRHSADCHECGNSLCRGNGFLVPGSTDMFANSPDTGKIALGAESRLRCHDCFVRDGGIARRPLRQEDWPKPERAEITVALLLTTPPDRSPNELLGKLERREWTLMDLQRLIRESYIPPRPPLRRKLYARIGGKPASVMAWDRWLKLLFNPAVLDRACELRQSDPAQAWLIGRAILCLADMIPAYPLFAPLNLQLGNLFDELGHPFDAGEAYARAYRGFMEKFDMRTNKSSESEIDRYKHDTLVSLERLTKASYEAESYSEGAERAFEWMAQARYHKDNSGVIRAHSWAGRCLLRLRKYELASQALDQGIPFSWRFHTSTEPPALEPENWLAVRDYANALRFSGRVSDAIEILIQLKDTPFDESGSLMPAYLESEIGYCYADLGNLEQAEHHLRLAIEQCPPDMVATQNYWLLSADQMASVRRGEVTQQSVIGATGEDFVDAIVAANRLVNSRRFEEAVRFIHQLERKGRLEKDHHLRLQLMLLLGVAHSRRKPPYIDEAYRCLEVAVAIADSLGSTSLRMRTRTRLAIEAFAHDHWTNYDRYVNESILIYDEASKKNDSSEARQQLRQSAFETFELIALAAIENQRWPELIWASECTRARNLSKWVDLVETMRDAVLQEEGSVSELRRALRSLIEVEVETEVRHTTGRVRGSDLRSLDMNRALLQKEIKRQLSERGRVVSDWDEYERGHAQRDTNH